MQPALCPTEEHFFELCTLNRELRIERDAAGEMSVMAPAGWESSRRNADISGQLFAWAMADGTGVAADSSAGYILPNGAVRSPDASWVSNMRLATLSPEQRSRFLPLCPDFVVELLSPTDRLQTTQEKMVEYIENGASLGWLIDPDRRVAYVYRASGPTERLSMPDSLAGDDVLPGLLLQLQRIWT